MNTPETPLLTEAEQIAKGEKIANLLGLRANSKGRYNTTDGDKTALGLYRTLYRYINEESAE